MEEKDAVTKVMLSVEGKTFGRYDARMDKTKVLKETEIFGSLSDTELAALSDVCVTRKLKEGETLFTAGEESKGLYVIVRGVFRAYRGNAEGREQIIHVERAVTTIAEVAVFDGKPYPSTVVAAEEGEVYFIPTREVKRLCISHPTIALAALKLLAKRLRKTALLVESLSLKEVDQRLAGFLLQEFKSRGVREKNKIKLQLPTFSIIASRVGSVREVVSRAFSKLEGEKLISVDKNHVAVILDEEGLRKYVGK